jgi:hypothetical protein
MWVGIASKLGQWFFTFVVMPFIAKFWADFLQKQEDKKAEDVRNTEIDKALKDFQEAPSAKEKEDAFKRLIRRRA